MDVKIINPFLEALLDVAANMAQLELKVGRPVLKNDKVAQGEVTGLISLDGGQTQGSMAITFNESALLLVYEKMLGEELTAMDETALDLAGEITNMVCGGAKQRLAEKGYEFALATPSMLSGKNHEIEHRGGGPVITMPLSLDRGEMFIEVSLNR